MFRNIARKLIEKYNVLGKEMRKEIESLRSERIGLRGAASLMLGMFIKEIDVLTPDKLQVIRQTRRLLDGGIK